MTFRVRQGRQDAVGRDLGRWVREGVGIFFFFCEYGMLGVVGEVIDAVVVDGG